MNPLQEKLNEIDKELDGIIKKSAVNELIRYVVNLTLEEAKRIVAESGEDYHEAYEALDKMKL